MEAYEEARRTCYDDTDVLLICFSIAEPDSLANLVHHDWLGEVNSKVLKTVPVSESFFRSKRMSQSASILIRINEKNQVADSILEKV